MTSAEISDKFMKAFEDQNWDEWKSYFTNDVAMEDMAVELRQTHWRNLQGTLKAGKQLSQI